jgi:hypothetical protein
MPSNECADKVMPFDALDMTVGTKTICKVGATLKFDRPSKKVKPRGRPEGWKRPGHLDGFVDDTGVHVMATGDASTRVYREMSGRKDILPAPFLGRMRILPRQGMGQVHRAMPWRQILLVQRPDPGQVVLEQGGERGGKGGVAVLIALARTALMLPGSA